MRLKAILLIPRREGILRLSQAETVIAIGSWEGFKAREISAFRPTPDGWAVAVVFQGSPIDEKAGCNLWFPQAGEIQDILKAMDRSDYLTAEVLGRGWSRGPRPYLPLWTLM
ncbi:hypothetical protein DRO29_05100 [Candidatus Bathyarchaeota archaeon]|nr:MAG: hypothetical protein DRO29_05100 [Candidatus Bathyarchaeota archaeon]